MLFDEGLQANKEVGRKDAPSRLDIAGDIARTRRVQVPVRVLVGVGIKNYVVKVGQLPGCHLVNAGYRTMAYGKHRSSVSLTRHISSLFILRPNTLDYQQCVNTTRVCVTTIPPNY